MYRELVAELLPEEAASAEKLNHRIARITGIPPQEITHIRIVRRSIDARRAPVKVRLVVHVYTGHKPETPIAEPMARNVANATPVHIAGMGPAGMFAALRCIELGLKPVIIERGKDVRSRRRDLAALTRDHLVNPDSNYCFGEGGAGTYSDGKLYTRSHKRGDIRHALETFCAFGAPEDILIDSHPHIGTNKLPGIIENMRQHILDCGGEVHFNQRITALETTNGAISGLQTHGGLRFDVRHLVLATGHSARDIFEMLHGMGILIEAKPFALGVRAEHPQALIDRVQYHCTVRDPYLPPASYALVNQYQNRGTFSFCMCPGGIIAPCATSPGEIVTNGWSPSKRNNPFANSGIVTEITLDDMHRAGYSGPLAGVAFQRQVEQACFSAGGGGQVAPAQRIADFIQRKTSATLPECSYLPGVASADLNAILPEFVATGLRQAFKAFGGKMKGYTDPEAILLAPETRTSSPVRIPRHKQLLQHPQVAGLYPCGEGAGYAGGIISAAMDGQRVADAVAVAVHA